MAISQILKQEKCPGNELVKTHLLVEYLNKTYESPKVF